ncbi:MAG: hypothetical protein HC923_01760 [Myxococcales bacterium]|nr:hypothetical protein [Myxococcales bacterium]
MAVHPEEAEQRRVVVVVSNSAAQSFPEMARRGTLAALVALGAAACGPDEDVVVVGGAAGGPVPRLDVRPDLLLGRTSDRHGRRRHPRPEYRSLAALIRDSLACEGGVLDLSTLQAGQHVLQVRALGPLRNSTRDVLYEAVVPVDVRGGSATPDMVVLEPKVAFLDLRWELPESEGQSACDLGLAWSYALEAVDPDGTRPASGRFSESGRACAEPGVSVPTPLVPGRYDITVSARKPSGTSRFSRHESVVLSPGLNTLHLAAVEVGHRLSVDWRFAIGVASPTRACDPHAFHRVHLRIEDLEDDLAILDELELDCSVPRPVTIPSLRLEPGRRVRVSMEAEGEHRVLGSTDFEMPEDDAVAIVDLTAHGSGVVAWSVVGDACIRATEFRVRAEDAETAEVVWFETVSSTNVGSVTTAALPYGSYRIHIAAFRGTTEVCSAAGTRSLGSLLETWDVFHLYSR